MKGNKMNKEKTVKKANYTDEDMAILRTEYEAHGNEGLAAIAEKLGKTVQSVRAKLVREKIYVTPEKPVKAAKDEGPTKKEMFKTLDGFGFDPAGLEGATKEALQRVIAVVGQKQATAE